MKNVFEDVIDHHLVDDCRISVYEAAKRLCLGKKPYPNDMTLHQAQQAWLDGEKVAHESWDDGDKVYRHSNGACVGNDLEDCSFLLFGAAAPNSRGWCIWKEPTYVTPTDEDARNRPEVEVRYEGTWLTDPKYFLVCVGNNKDGTTVFMVKDENDIIATVMADNCRMLKAPNRMYRQRCASCSGQGGFDYGRGELRCWDECEQCKGMGYIE